METNLKVGDVGSQEAANMPPPIMVQPWWRGPVFGAIPPPVILQENLSASKETEISQGDVNSENENSAKKKGSSSYYLITFRNLNPGHCVLFFIISDCLELHFLDEKLK
jgi:hypothetical protein